MLKKIVGLLVVLAMAVSLLAGCGASREDTASSKPQAADTFKGSANGEAKAESKDGAVEASAVTGSGTASQSVSNAILAQRKIIRNANVSVEVDDFDKAYGRIKSMISAFGFIQESNIKKDKVYVDDKEKLVTNAVVIIRVDKDKFESVLSDIKGLGLLLDESIKSDDVTDKFFDTESRLRLLKYEESRLEQYLNKITDPDTIFKTESRLTDIRHEIEGLTGTLKKWSDLVDLSTITINIREKSLISQEKPPKEKSYWQRLTEGFTDSFKGVVTFIGELIILIVQALPALVLLGVFGFFGYKAYKRNRKAKKDVPADKGDNDSNISM